MGGGPAPGRLWAYTRRSPIVSKCLRRRSRIVSKCLRRRSPVVSKCLRRRSPVVSKCVRRRSPVVSKWLRRRSPVVLMRRAMQPAVLCACEEPRSCITAAQAPPSAPVSLRPLCPAAQLPLSHLLQLPQPRRLCQLALGAPCCVLSPSQSLSAQLSSALGSVSLLARAHLSRSRSLGLGVCSLALPRTSCQWLGLACCPAAKAGVSCCSAWQQAEAGLESASALLARGRERLLLPHVSRPVSCAQALSALYTTVGWTAHPGPLEQPHRVYHCAKAAVEHVYSLKERG